MPSDADPPAKPAPAETDRDGRVGLVGLDRGEIVAALAEIGVPAKARAMRAKQVWHWVYHRGARRFADMTSISKDMRALLETRFALERPALVEARRAGDGTRKWLLGCADGAEVEAVYIPEEDRGALCLSTQVGCTLACRFCRTGTQRLVRNLSAAEIVGQVLVGRDELGEWPAPKGGRMVSNIVVMGMGEPLYNYENVAKALRIVMDREGIAISKRRITLSTAGVAPRIERCGAELGVNLAVSLHAPNDELRDRLVPLNRKHPIAELLAACRRYPGSSNARRITFEYILLRGVNDGAAEARELVRRLRGIPAKINLIPFNAWPGAPYEPSTRRATETFARIVNDAGYSSPVRAPRGRDIMAACGQLRSESVKARRSGAAAPTPSRAG